MPRIGGLDLLKRIRDLGVTAPVLMMSGDTQKEAVALLAGPVGYLHKPFNLRDLEHSVAPRPRVRPSCGWRLSAAPSTLRTRADRRGSAERLVGPFSYSRGRVTGLLRSAERSAACVTSMTWRACSGVTSTGRSRAIASMKWMVSACIGPW